MRPGYCRCNRPVINPRRPEFCRRCGIRHDPRAQSNVSTIGEFFARLSDLPGVSAAALHHAQVREQAGREEFGLSYLGRDNDAEACEEAADGIIYAHLSALNDRRAGTQDIDPDLLDAAHHFALAHAALERRGR